MKPLRRSAMVVATVGLLIAVPSCAFTSHRSVTKYCSTFYGEGEELRQKFLKVNPEADPLGGLAALAGAPGDYEVFFARLADVAPGEIQHDVEAIRDALKKQKEQAADVATNPLGTLASGFITSLQVSGSYERVDRYTRERCGPPPRASAGTESSTTVQSTVPTTLPAGERLGRIVFHSGPMCHPSWPNEPTLKVETPQLLPGGLAMVSCQLGGLKEIASLMCRQHNNCGQCRCQRTQKCLRGLTTSS